MSAQEYMKSILEREFKAAAQAYDAAVEAHHNAEDRTRRAGARWERHYQAKEADAQAALDSAWQRLHAAQIATGRTVYEDDLYDHDNDEYLPVSTLQKLQQARLESEKE